MSFLRLRALSGKIGTKRLDKKTVPEERGKFDSGLNVGTISFLPAKGS
jgi:hypothetical protein